MNNLWLVSLKPTKDKNEKRDFTAFDMFSASYIFDKLNNALLAVNFILSKNKMPVVSALEN